MATQPEYRGRFAPSPTGPLHVGSLLTAVASYLDARSASGTWLLRIEDIDPPREVPGAADSILRSLEAHGLYWDETELYQSTRLEAYAEALDELTECGDVFRCCCTRATLGPGGSCLKRCSPTLEDVTALRVCLLGNAGFDDRILGPQQPKHGANDLVLRRKDNLYAYALAVVVDDAWQSITDVVRGEDLLFQTFAQLELLAQLKAEQPSYAHVPVVCDASGIKLSKQAGATAIDDKAALKNLRKVLELLCQDSAQLHAGSTRELLELATSLWNPQALQARRALVYP
ncbi:tRNA glutamyl-Q(34) synthetase GluQRS [Congregibacter brevis]|uniref:tRNA glutamyl-Q(34) synthetase GluQRS n=1 Tax=Congregibacter brevis TaxID=3081201 RepID=A0ABZ0IES2_9GAMM|nr:tRNA glutamyl-Q(34) synthetase GluQRS [Congregibacter sp. IMCC45268]